MVHPNQFPTNILNAYHCSPNQVFDTREVACCCCYCYSIAKTSARCECVSKPNAICYVVALWIFCGWLSHYTWISLHLVPRCVKWVYRNPALYGSMLIIQCAHPHLKKKIVGPIVVCNKKYFSCFTHVNAMVKWCLNGNLPVLVLFTPSSHIYQQSRKLLTIFHLPHAIVMRLHAYEANVNIHAPELADAVIFVVVV